MINRFTGKNIWIIGASEGIGFALANSLAQSGANLFISGRNEQKLKDALTQMNQPTSNALQLDVTSPASISEAYTKLKTRWNNIDYFIYNAGDYEPLEATKVNPISVEKANKIIDVNLKGFVTCLGFVIPKFLEQGSGNIAVTSSVAGYFGMPKSFTYGASKAALINLAETLRIELSQKNINIQVINPGFVKTRLTEKNSFDMPFILTPEEASDKIMKKLGKDIFEIHFPAKFSIPLKILRLLKYEIFFPIVRKLTKV
jgi:short-subunit dehydrogenase